MTTTPSLGRPRSTAHPVPPVRAAAAAGVPLAAIGALVAVSRLPFLGGGYGTDTDAWKVAFAARAIATTGHYVTSRLPGYPAHEYASALAWRGGPVALNALTALFTAIAAMLFARVWRRVGGRDAALAALALAFVPTVFISSVSTIDYLWALAFVLGAVDAALGGRPVLAGVLLGVATGCRITSMAFVLPCALLLADAGAAGRLRRIATLGITSVLVGAAWYVPVERAYGPNFMSYYEPFSGQQKTLAEFLSGMLVPGKAAFSPFLILGQATVGVWGLLGATALALAVALAALGVLRRRALPADAPVPPASRLRTLAWVGSVLMITVLYVRLPHDEGYLIPALPFALLLLGVACGRTLFRALAVAVLIAPFVLGIDVVPPKKGLAPRHRSALARPLALGRGETWVLDPLRGPLLMDADKRARETGVIRRVVAERPRMAETTRMIAGSLKAKLFYDLPETRADEWYFDWLPRAAVDSLVSAGHPVVVLPDARARTQRIAGYDLAGIPGVRPLFEDDDAAP